MKKTVWIGLIVILLIGGIVYGVVHRMSSFKDVGLSELHWDKIPDMI